LCGYKKVNLQPGESADVTLSIDPRLLAQYDGAQKTWITAKGDYEPALSSDARTPVAKTVVRLAPAAAGQVRTVHR
jgi:beta-glucosidase